MLSTVYTTKLSVQHTVYLCHYRDALSVDPANEASLLGLANLYLSKNDLDGCEVQAQTALRVNESSESVSTTCTSQTSYTYSYWYCLFSSQSI
jgi:hypothetical protein